MNMYKEKTVGYSLTVVWPEKKVGFTEGSETIRKKLKRRTDANQYGISVNKEATVFFFFQKKELAKAAKRTLKSLDWIDGIEVTEEREMERTEMERRKK